MVKVLSILNWNEYQARTDKELPWLKLWGKLFLRHWWQEMKDEHKIIPIILLDSARRFNNRLPQNPDYYRRNYNLKTSSKTILEVCKSLRDIGFLSDVMSDCSPSPSNLILSPSILEDSKKPFKKPNLEELTEALKAGGLEAAAALVEAKKFLNHYVTVGWVVGKARKPMQNWRGAVATWLENRREWAKDSSDCPNPMNFNKTQIANMEALSDFTKRKKPTRPEDLRSGDGNAVLSLPGDKIQS